MRKETWDEIQQTLLLGLSFGMWIVFEYWCYKSPEFASASHTTAVRLVLTNIVTGIFAYIYTKSTGNGKGDNTPNG
ncbi:MAG: hypothetical protein OXU51_07850 [Candidatus Poribacteria bacterium]|nr:hypothetical protein [Candidatus Poribacteria bacterium]